MSISLGCLWGCREAVGVVEIMRGGRQDVVFGGGRLGTVSVGEPARKQDTTSRELKAKYGDMENPPGFIRLCKPSLIIGTYPKGEKVGPLSSVLSPKPKSDLKNRMLTPTILTVLCYLNNLKPNLYLLSTPPLHDSPCFLCLLYSPWTVKLHV